MFLILMDWLSGLERLEKVREIGGSNPSSIA